MPNMRIFTSFPKQDERLRDFLIGQAKNAKSPFEFTDMSVHQPWDSSWKTSCRTKIRGCDGMIAIITSNTSGADGQLWEINCADEEGVPILCIKTSEFSPSAYTLSKIGNRRVFNWDWATISSFINKL